MNKSFELLDKIICSLYNGDCDTSVNGFSEALKLPKAAVRNILGRLLGNRYLNLELWDNLSDEIWEDELEDDRLAEELQSGRLDDCQWELPLNDNYSDPILLSLSPMENQALIANGFRLSDIHTGSFAIKEIFGPVPQKQLDLQSALLDCISKRRQVTFLYDDKTKQVTEKVTCLPVLLITNVSNREVYLKDSARMIYPLSRIHPNSLKVGSVSEALSSEDEQLNRYIWSISYDPKEVPTAVKVRIRNSTPNILSKVQNDTAYRATTRRLYPDGEDYIYEDTVLGLADFRKWTRSYGSAMEVLEPVSCRDAVIESTKKLKLKYDRLDSWDCGNL